MSDDIEANSEANTETETSTDSSTPSESNTTRDLKAALGLDPDYTPDPDTTLLPNCPRCDHPVARTSIIGPTDAIAGPCGCRVAPGFARRARNRRRSGRNGSSSATGHDTDYPNTRNNSHTQ